MAWTITRGLKGKSFVSCLAVDGVTSCRESLKQWDERVMKNDNPGHRTLCSASAPYIMAMLKPSTGGQADVETAKILEDKKTPQNGIARVSVLLTCNGGVTRNALGCPCTVPHRVCTNLQHREFMQSQSGGPGCGAVAQKQQGPFSRHRLAHCAGRTKDLQRGIYHHWATEQRVRLPVSIMW